MYDYYKEVKDDVLEAIDENYALEDIEDWVEFEDELYDSIFNDDHVTGNGSGSYTFSRAKACEYLQDNFDLLYDALNEFDTFSTIKQGPEACDVLIRCYLLDEAISEALEELHGDWVEAREQAGFEA